MKKEARDVILSFRIARSMADRIDYYQTIHHRRKTDAVIDLLELALFIAENAQKLKDPEIVTYLRNNLYNIQLVDDIMQWPQDRIDAIVGALLGEKDRRLRVRI